MDDTKQPSASARQDAQRGKDQAVAEPAGWSDRSYRALRLCTNFRAGYTLPSCGARGAAEVHAELARQWPERTMPFEFETVHCMGKCHIGPTLRLVPAGPFLMGVKTGEDVKRLLDLLEAGEIDRAAEEFPLPVTV